MKMNQYDNMTDCGQTTTTTTTTCYRRNKIDDDQKVSGKFGIQILDFMV